MTDQTREIVRIGGKLFLICAVAAVSLGVINEFTEPVIEARRESDRQAVVELFLSQGQAGERRTVDHPVVQAVTPVLQGGSRAGYILELVGAGYGGDMRIMAMYSGSGRIQDARLLDNLETPGLGKKAEDPQYMQMFVGTGGEQPVPVSKEMLDGGAAAGEENVSPPSNWSSMAPSSLDTWLFGESAPESVGGPEAVSGATITFTGVAEALAAGSAYVQDNLGGS